MERTSNDSWDLASSVGATATMVAAGRALASREANPLIQDPYAEPLVRAVGIDFFTKLVDGVISTSESTTAARPQLMTGMMAVRTRFFDDFFIAATESGVRQAVILASGLDSRAYRLPWPDGTVVYEIDQPKVIEAKTATMADIGATPTAERRAVAVDLRDDWPEALRRAGFDDTLPAAWSAEGLLAVSAARSAGPALRRHHRAVGPRQSPVHRSTTPTAAASLGERANAVNDAWIDHGFDLKLSDLFFAGDRQPVVEYLTAAGWQVSARTRPELWAGYGREFPDSEVTTPMGTSQSIVAVKR